MSGNSEFVYRTEMHPDDIPVETVTPKELGITTRLSSGEYAAVPEEVWDEFRPRERLLLALHFAYRTFRPDDADGWYRLSTGLYSRAGLSNHNIRWRAVNDLERAGKIETRRTNGKTTLVRLIRPGPKILDSWKRRGTT